MNNKRLNQRDQCSDGNVFSLFESQSHSQSLTWHQSSSSRCIVSSRTIFLFFSQSTSTHTWNTIHHRWIWIWIWINGYFVYCCQIDAWQGQLIRSKVCVACEMEHDNWSITLTDFVIVCSLQHTAAPTALSLELLELRTNNFMMQEV